MFDRDDSFHKFEGGEDIGGMCCGGGGGGEDGGAVWCYRNNADTTNDGKKYLTSE